MVHVGNPLYSVEGLLHACFFVVFAGITGYLIYKWFFYFPAHEQDQYYLRGGGAQKMVRLKGKPQKLGDIYWKYTAELYIENQRLGADMEKVGLSFERVSDQEVEVDPKTSGRYPIEKFGQPGIVEFIEVEGSEIDLLLKKNLDRETPFEFILKGPFGQFKYTGKGSFYDCKKASYFTPSEYLFIAQRENLQAFFKVLKDLEVLKKKKVSILYFADSKAEVLFPAELEFWKTTLGWNVTVAVKDGKTADTSYTSGSIYTSNSFERLPKPSAHIDVFGCVPQLSLITIASAMDKLGWNTKNIRWLS